MVKYAWNLHMVKCKHERNGLQMKNSFHLIRSQAPYQVSNDLFSIFVLNLQYTNEQITIEDDTITNTRK